MAQSDRPGGVSQYRSADSGLSPDSLAHLPTIPIWHTQAHGAASVALFCCRPPLRPNMKNHSTFLVSSNLVIPPFHSEVQHPMWVNPGWGNA